MSNIMKYPFVNLQGKEARKVSYEKDTGFTPLEKPKRVVVRDAEEVERELEQGKSIDDIFHIINPVKIVGGDRPEEDEEPESEEEILPEDIQRTLDEANEKAEEIIASARAQADEIVVEARRQADDVRSQAHEEGVELGREEGIQAARAEVEQIKQGLEDERRSLRDEYDKLVADMEPQFVRVVSSLMDKLVGVELESDSDLILHLIRSGFKDVRKNAERIIVRVSGEDALVAETHKNELLELVGEDVSVDIVSQESMEKGECIIETDNQMLDAGIRTQLENLKTSLMMLV